MTDTPKTAETSGWQTLKQQLKESFSLELVFQRRTYDKDGPGEHNALQRKNAYRFILLGLTVILAPVNAHNYFTGHMVPATAGLVLLLVFIANIWQLSQEKKVFLSPVIVMVLTIALIFLSIFYGQSYSLYWLYPMLVALPVLLRSRWAVWLGIFCALLVTPVVFLRFDTNTALIIVISMVHTWLVSAGLMYVMTKQTRRLTDLANIDPLTGAYNRRYFEIHAQHAYDHWERTERPASFLMIDIDHFKQVNDTFGHDAGDVALVKLVEIISARIRKVDTVSRFGGEEFLILLWETDINGARIVAEDVRKIVENTKILPKGPMTISIGMCDLTVVNDVSHWFKLADAALYVAKEKGRNRVEQPLVMPARKVKATAEIAPAA
jgi:diguanylate cyclase (GGDEF)-like protein